MERKLIAEGRIGMEDRKFGWKEGRERRGLGEQEEVGRQMRGRRERGESELHNLTSNTNTIHIHVCT